MVLPEYTHNREERDVCLVNSWFPSVSLYYLELHKYRNSVCDWLAGWLPDEPNEWRSHLNCKMKTFFHSHPLLLMMMMIIPLPVPSIRLDSMPVCYYKSQSTWHMWWHCSILVNGRTCRRRPDGFVVLLLLYIENPDYHFSCGAIVQWHGGGHVTMELNTLLSAGWRWQEEECRNQDMRGNYWLTYVPVVNCKTQTIKWFRDYKRGQRDNCLLWFPFYFYFKNRVLNCWWNFTNNLYL